MDNYISNGLDQPSSNSGNGINQVHGRPMYICCYVDVATPTINPTSSLSPEVQSNGTW